MKAFVEEILQPNGDGHYHVFGAHRADDAYRKFTQCFVFNTNPEFDQKVWGKALAYKQAIEYAKRIEEMTAENRTIIYQTPD
ncbi:MAG: hypothetical protein ACK50Z_04310 [Betaproteobacteria bacterium]|jgi:hypothetical protein